MSTWLQSIRFERTSLILADDLTAEADAVVDLFISDGGWQGQRLSTILPVVASTSAVLSLPFIPIGRWCLAIRKKTWKVRAEQ